MVRRAEDREAKACRILMPEVFGAFYAPDLWVAIDEETGLLVGAGAVGWQLVSEMPGFPVHLHVVAPLRRRRVGTTLIGAIAAGCRGETRRLLSWFAVPVDGPAAGFMMQSGFSVTRRIYEFEAAAGIFYPKIKSLVDRLDRAGKLPGRYSVVSLREAPAEALAALLAEHFREAPGAALSRLARGAANHDPDRSVVLLEGAHVRGAMLYTWNEGDPMIDAWVVAPEARGTGADMLLVEAATRHGLDASMQRFRFSCDHDNRHTIKLAGRGGAVMTGTRVRLALEL